MYIEFYDLNKIDSEKVSFVVLISKFKEQWLYVKHKKRSTWEVPGGKREEGESIKDTAIRELYEESGAISSELFEVSDYAMVEGEKKSYGRLYYVNIKELEALPQSEIGEVKLFKKIPINLTYKEIHEQLVEKVIGFLKIYP